MGDLRDQQELDALLIHRALVAARAATETSLGQQSGPPDQNRATSPEPDHSEQSGCTG